MLLCEVQQILGNRWTDIAKVLTDRIDNAVKNPVKNRFSLLCKKKANDETFYKENNVPYVIRERLISARIAVSSLLREILFFHFINLFCGFSVLSALIPI